MSSDSNASNENADSSKQQFIEALRRGDSKAYEQLYREYRPMVMNFVRLNSGRPEDGADLLQEALLVLMRRLQDPAFVLTGLKAFIYRTCSNKWLDRLRKERNGPVRITETEVLEQSPDEPEDRPYPITDAQLEEAVRLLDDPCRDLLIRFYFERQSLEEIARSMDLGNANNAKTKRFRCMERLIKLVKKHFGDE